jgi:predicted ferric reductase
MWLSMALGISISNKLARLWPGGPLAFELHQYLSLLGLNLALFHALILLGDRYIQYSLSQVLVPFQSTAYEPLWVGLGQLAFYALIVISLSFYVRKRIGHKLWRWLHFLTFGAFAMALLHGITSGSDSSSLLVQAAYVASGASLLFLSIYRVVGAIFPVQTSKRSARG